MTLHVASGGGKDRNFILHRVNDSTDASTINVLRLLHASIDLDHMPDPPQMTVGNCD